MDHLLSQEMLRIGISKTLTFPFSGHHNDDQVIKRGDRRVSVFLEVLMDRQVGLISGGYLSQTLLESYPRVFMEKNTPSSKRVSPPVDGEPSAARASECGEGI